MATEKEILGKIEKAKNNSFIPEVEKEKLISFYNSKLGEFGKTNFIQKRIDGLKLSVKLKTAKDIAFIKKRIKGLELQLQLKKKLGKGGMVNRDYSTGGSTYKVGFNLDGKKKFKIISEHSKTAAEAWIKHAYPGASVILASKVKEEGGEVGEVQEDLFNNYAELTPPIQALIDEYNVRFDDEDSYALAREMQSRFEQEGYTFDWGLDGEAYYLRKKKVSDMTDDEIINLANKITASDREESGEPEYTLEDVELATDFLDDINNMGKFSPYQY